MQQHAEKTGVLRYNKQKVREKKNLISKGNKLTRKKRGKESEKRDKQNACSRMLLLHTWHPGKKKKKEAAVTERKNL
jgi:hypothetical protein